MPNQIKTSLTNRKGYEDLIKTNISSGWINMYGCSMGSDFKPFTTLYPASGLDVSIAGTGIGIGIASYHRPVFSLSTTGIFLSNGVRATSLGLNPYGSYTLGENIISGTGNIPDDINLTLDPNSVRTFGHKNPLTLVGWGYDIWGYPAPNSNYGWTISGHLGMSGTNMTPNTVFLSSGIATSPTGSDIAPHNFLAGPTDFRWDPFRKIWTGQYGIWSGKILKTYINNVSVAGGIAFPAFANELLFDVRIFDGVAGSMVFSGLAPFHLTGSGSAYSPWGNYKIISPPTGTPVVLQTMDANHKMEINFILSEVPAVSGCGT